MGLPVEGHPAVAVNDPSARPRLLVHLIDVGSHVIEALRPKKKAVPWVAPSPHRQIAVQGRVGVTGGKAEISGASLGVEATGHRNGLQQSGFARAVLPHQKGDGSGEGQGVVPAPQGPDGREGGKIAVRRDRLI